MVALNRRRFVKLVGAGLAMAGAASVDADASVSAETVQNEQKPSADGVVIYPAPEGEVLSEDYAVEVNGKSVPVYVIQSQWHDKKYSAAYFDFEGTVTVKIKPNLSTLKTSAALEQLAIRPEKYGIKPSIADGAATFTTDRHFDISFEPTGQNSPLHLFSNPLETKPPKSGDPNVVYFGPGIHKPTHIHLTAGQTLYIAGGAIVKSAVTSTGDEYSYHRARHFVRQRLATLQGPDGAHGLAGRWHKHPDSKTSSSAEHGTGQWLHRGAIRCESAISGSAAPGAATMTASTPCNSSNVTIRNCFVHTDDDGIAVKGTALAGQYPKTTENIVVEDCTFWIEFANGFRHRRGEPRYGLPELHGAQYRFHSFSKSPPGVRLPDSAAR